MNNTILDEDEISSQEAYATLFEENNERERKLYGPLLPDMRLLRQRNYGVWWVGDKLSVDHKLVTVREFKKLAQRERRLKIEGSAGV